MEKCKEKCVVWEKWADVKIELNVKFNLAFWDFQDTVTALQTQPTLSECFLNRFEIQKDIQFISCTEIISCF